MTCFYTVAVAACMAGFTVGGPGLQFMSAHIQSWEEGSLYALTISEVPEQGLRTFPLESTNRHFRGYSNGDVTDMEAILHGTSAEVLDGDAETPASDMDPEGGHSAPYTIKDEARYFSMGSDGSGHPYVIEIDKVSEEGKPQVLAKLASRVTRLAHSCTCSGFRTRTKGVLADCNAPHDV